MISLTELEGVEQIWRDSNGRLFILFYNYSPIFNLKFNQNLVLKPEVICSPIVGHDMVICIDEKIIYKDCIYTLLEGEVTLCYPLF